ARRWLLRGLCTCALATVTALRWADPLLCPEQGDDLVHGGTGPGTVVDPGAGLERADREHRCGAIRSRRREGPRGRAPIRAPERRVHRVVAGGVARRWPRDRERLLVRRRGQAPVRTSQASGFVRDAGSVTAVGRRTRGALPGSLVVARRRRDRACRVPGDPWAGAHPRRGMGA